MRHTLASALAGLLSLSLMGCLGTKVETGYSAPPDHFKTTTRYIAMPRVIEAWECRNGLASVTNHVPAWGVAIGVLTLGIIVPVTTSYRCA